MTRADKRRAQKLLNDASEALSNLKRERLNLNSEAHDAIERAADDVTIAQDEVEGQRVR